MWEAALCRDDSGLIATPGRVPLWLPGASEANSPSFCDLSALERLVSAELSEDGSGHFMKRLG